ncbi:SUMF1/EgtB/PvdO family nonheme iron enzyme, partial [Acinetobacter baumannii]
PLEPTYGGDAPEPASCADELRWLGVEGGLRQIGHAGDAFAFDNEGPRHRVWLEPFQLANRLVSEAGYADFIADGGYR